MKSIRSFFRKLIREEDGQSAVVVVLSLTLLFGCAALGVDLGQAYSDKQKMQNAADFAATAAALYLSKEDSSGAGNAVNAVYDIAEKNGARREEVTITTPYNGDPLMIEVICRRNVKYSFARVLGYRDGDVVGRAVAKKSNYWVGEALPFLNMDGPYWDSSYVSSDAASSYPPNSGAIMSIWDKGDKGHNPGNFERIAEPQDGLGNKVWKLHTKDTEKMYSQGYYTVDYSEGVTVVNGKRAYIKEYIQSLYDTHETVYLFSLSQEAMSSGRYDRTRNNQDIPLNDLVLLQVDILEYHFGGGQNNKKDHSMIVQVKEIYDIYNNDLPTKFLRGGSSSGLVE